MLIRFMRFSFFRVNLNNDLFIGLRVVYDIMTCCPLTDGENLFLKVRTKWRPFAMWLNLRAFR
jgi:hypothetical protein